MSTAGNGWLAARSKTNSTKQRAAVRKLAAAKQGGDGRTDGVAEGNPKLLSFADALPPPQGERDAQLREALHDADKDVAARAALDLAAAYASDAPNIARSLLRMAALGSPLTAGRALLRLARDAGGESCEAAVEFLDGARQVTSLPREDDAALDPELLGVRLDIATAFGLAGSLDAAFPMLLEIESALRRRGDSERGAVLQDDELRHLAALTSLRLGEFQMESSPSVADEHFKRAVMLGSGSLRATAALERGRLLQHHAGGLGHEIERQYMLAIDLDDSYASPLALIAMGDILCESGRRGKAESFWQDAIAKGDAEIRDRAERRLSGRWQAKRRRFKRDDVDEHLDFARPLDVKPSTELGRIASGRAPDAPVEDEQVRPVIVVGAGTGGHYLLPSLAHGYRVVGFVDDDPTVGSVHGVKVLGSISELGDLLRSNREVAQVIFAIPTASGATRLRVLRAAHRHSVDVVSLPSMFELRHGHSLLAQLRPFEVHETYGDAPWDIDRQVLHHVRGRRVAIVGASSVLGAELARRVAYGQPRHLLLLDEAEVALMSIASEIRQFREVMDCEARIVDYAAQAELAEALTDSVPPPEIVFYCGGLHHAPESALRSSHAARANVLAAANVARAASAAGCAEFVMASMDRAAHRMGPFDMTKALAETAVLQLAADDEPACVGERGSLRSAGEPSGFRVTILRLPNLWARDGAVVRRLTEQLRQGGPLEVKSGRERRFAPTWEAAQTMLRLLGGNHASGIFALSGGENVEIRALADRLLLIHGLSPGLDIHIVSSSRPDTKASLMLWGRNELCGGRSVSNAVSVEQNPELKRKLERTVGPLINGVRNGDRAKIEKALKPIDPIKAERSAAVA